MFYLKGNTSAIVYVLLLIYNFIFQEITAQIVGGEDATIEQMPFMVSVRVENNIHHCGGAIIGAGHILTAAHCFVSSRPDSVTVLIGSTRSDGTGGTVHPVCHVTIHPDFVRGPQNVRSDIAVLTLMKNIDFNRFAQKINLPSRNTEAAVVALTAGWGYLSATNKVVSPLLQRAHINVISNRVCAEQLRSEGTIINPGQICTYLRHGVGVCVKDSGGPLVANNEVIGVLSFGVPCARGFPDVFTRVYEYKGWIEGVMVHSPVPRTPKMFASCFGNFRHL